MTAMALFEKGKKAYAALDEVGPIGSPEREKAKHETHVSIAAECLALARANGGIYNKAAQFVASLQGGAGDAGIPKPYIEALSVLTDKAPFRPFEDMDACFREEFGMSSKEAFASIDEAPIAAASLAQVHRAVTRDGREVAVKMQYPWLKHHLASDFAVFAMFGQQIKPGGMDLSWLVKDFQVSLTAELDFELEANNSERARDCLKSRRDALVPRPVREFTSKRVLCTEFVREMVRCNDAAELKKRGFDPRKVGSAIAGVFAEMVFTHGFVHGDPHAGNVYVCDAAEANRVDPRGGGSKEASSSDDSASKPVGLNFRVVLLDHGLYHEMPPDMVKDFRSLVSSCVRGDHAMTRRVSRRFAGKDLHRFFPLLLSPWFVFGARDITAADLRAAARGALPPGVRLEDVGRFLVALHDEGGTNMLGVLHSLGYTRGILNDLKFPEALRLRAYARYASQGGRGGVAALRAAFDAEFLAWLIALSAPVAPVFALAGALWVLRWALAPAAFALAFATLLLERLAGMRDGA